MNTAIVMLGSNFNPELNLELVKEKLSDYFDITKQSNILVNKPVGNKYKNDFHNQALKLLSVETAEETRYIFKKIEIEMGRTPESKAKGEIPIDIDLIFWNDIQIDTDYNHFDFVTKCVDEIR